MAKIELDVGDVSDETLESIYLYLESCLDSYWEEKGIREDNFRDDVEADADTLRMAGHGTDEDYGYFGELEYS